MRRNLTMDMANKGSPNMCQSWVSWGAELRKTIVPGQRGKEHPGILAAPCANPLAPGCKA